MSAQTTVRDWARLLYYFMQNTISLIGVGFTTGSAITLVAFWVYDFMLPGPPHPYVGILIFLTLPGVFVMGLLLIPLGILLRRHKLHKAGEIPHVYPEIDLKTPVVQNSLLFIAVATAANVIIFSFASYRGVSYMDSTTFAARPATRLWRRNILLTRIRRMRAWNAWIATSAPAPAGSCVRNCPACGRFLRSPFTPIRARFLLP